MSGGHGFWMNQSSSSLEMPDFRKYFQSAWPRLSFPQRTSKVSHRRSFSNLAWYLSLGVLKVFPISSVWTSFAAELTRRISRIARTVARHWFRNALTNDLSLLWWGYQCPYKPENRAVVRGSLIGVYRRIQG